MIDKLFMSIVIENNKKDQWTSYNDLMLALLPCLRIFTNGTIHL